MKMFTKLALVSSMAISANAMAMQSMDDAALSAATGQDGINIGIGISKIDFALILISFYLIIKLKRQISDLKGLISNKRNKFFQDAQAEMTKVEEELSTKEQELTDRTITLERTQIVSPIDAMVKNISLQHIY